MINNNDELIKRIYSWENLFNAYQHAAKGKWFEDEVAKFSQNLEENLIEIQNELIKKTYKVGMYHEFYVYEPKNRLVMALKFKDRVVQWAVYLQVNDKLDNEMICHSYACRIGKGTTKAADKLQEWCTIVSRKSEDWYYLKLDISKYFYRVNHKVLLDILKRKFPNQDGFIWLMSEIIECSHTPFGLPPGKKVDEVLPEERLYDVGMPIGNLTSQMLANLCLNELDQYIKHELSVHYYIRYMDDMIILHNNHRVLKSLKQIIENYLNNILKLELNSKTTINKVKNGISFVGCRIFPGYRKMSKKSVKKMKSRMRYISNQYNKGAVSYEKAKSTMQSYYGLMSHCATIGLQKWVKNNIDFDVKNERNEKIMKNLAEEAHR